MDYVEITTIRLMEEVPRLSLSSKPGFFACVHCPGAKAVALLLTRLCSKSSRMLNRCPLMALVLRVKRGSMLIVEEVA